MSTDNERTTEPINETRLAAEIEAAIEANNAARKQFLSELLAGFRDKGILQQMR